MQTFILTLKLTILSLFTTVILISCSSNAQPNVTAPASVQKLPVDIVVVHATQVEQPEVVAGSLIPNREVEIMSEINKKITHVFFQDGSYVEQGQTLYKLDDTDIHAKMKQLQVELNLAQINEKRLNALLLTETVRQEEYDVALAKVQSLEAAMQAFRVELSKTIIRAPFNGKIGITKVHTGALVSPGMPMVVLQDQSVVKLLFAVSEKYLQTVKPGNAIEFSVAGRKEKFKAVVTATEPGIDVNSRSITLVAVAKNQAALLKPGMSVTISFNTANTDQKGILLPTEALIPGSGGYAVFTVKDGLAKITPVTIINRDEINALIDSGLQSGDTVMVSNILRAADGTPVSVAIK